jgi:cellulose synthase/poly-beta-1,6-N-acetylglucosamine synthase-like glycosyltransferase
MMPYFTKSEVMAVTPSMKIYEPKNWLQKIQWSEFLIGIFLRKIFAFLGSIHVTPGPFSIYKREFFLKHGFYKHAHNTEDIELALRIQSNNYEIENAHDAYVYTVGPHTFKGLWNQRLRWYYGFLRNTEDYRELFSWKHGALGLFILPASFFSVSLVIASVIYTVYQIVSQSFDKLVYLQATGWDLTRIHINFDAFFLNLNSVAILGILSLIIGIIVLLAAKKIAGERSIIRHYLWFLFTYWILFSVWWSAAIYMRLTGRRITWMHKSQVGS